MRQKVYLLFILSFFSIESFSQSPWVNSQGSFYGQASSTFLSYSSIINENTSDIISTDTTTSDLTFGVFGEYSFSNSTSVLIDASYKSVTFDDQNLSGLGDSRIRIKHQLSEKIPFAVFYGYTAPLSKRQGALRTGYNQHALEFGVTTGVGKENFYAYGAFGYKHRSNIPNQILIDAEFGLNAGLENHDLFIMLSINGALNTSMVQDSLGTESVLYHNNGEYLSPGLKVAYNLADHFWINIGAYGAIRARNLGAAPSLTIGLAYSLRKE